MKKPLDGKYHLQTIEDLNGFTNDIVVVKTSNNQPIPEDEPVMLFRARDRNALPKLISYRQLCIEDGCTPYHIANIDAMIEKFTKFKEEHPERMKQPGITLGK